MTDNQNRPPAQSSIQAIGNVSSDIVAGLKQQPALLAIIVLNVIAIGFAAWFLGKLAEGNRSTIDRLMSACFPPSHQSRADFGEFR